MADRVEGETFFRIAGLSKSFGTTQALEQVDFDVRKGEVLALLGGNGSGKSTLIKILAGVESADGGRLEMNGFEQDLRHMSSSIARERGLHFVHQEASIFPDLSVTENLAIGHGFDSGLGGRIQWQKARRRAAVVLERFRIDAHPDQLLSELGSAKQTMVAIARALQDQDVDSRDILVLDEPTASLPAPEVDQLLTALRSYADRGQSIIYVTHRLEEVFRVADRVTMLRDGQVVGTVSPSEIDHDGLVELMMGRTVKQIERLRGTVEGGEILKVRDLSTGPLRGVNFTLCDGEVVGVAGLIGSGRSTLLRALFGVVPIQEGEVVLGGAPLSLSSPCDAMDAGFAYVPEDRRKDAAFAQLSVGENLSITVASEYWTRGWTNSRRQRRDATALLAAFMIQAESEEAPLGSLSGGNQQKVILARWLRRNPLVLLLDEPTQGVDVGARAEIYEFIHNAVSNNATALVASSDFEELARICDRVLVLRKGELIAELSGDQLDADTIGIAANAEMALA